MKGTPGFSGARLREAREARGLSVLSLAELLGVTRSAISYYENDANSPQPEVMERVARILNLPVQFFFQPPNLAEVGPIFYRSQSSATKTARLRGERKVEWLHQMVPYLCRFVRLPKPDFPSVARGWATLSDADLERLATNLRAHWKLGEGPISDMVLLLENNGAIVTTFHLDAAALDAFSFWSNEEARPYIAISIDKESAVRVRYDAAHELGHMVLHRNVSKQEATNPANFRLIEHQAHRFAGAFLIPHKSFAEDFVVPSLDGFRAMKPKWLVSMGMMLHRAIDLELVSQEYGKRLWINYTRRWKMHEPLDDQLPIEKPRLIKRSFEALVEHRIQSRDAILAALPYSQTDIEELANLPYGYLKSDLLYDWAVTLLK